MAIVSAQMRMSSGWLRGNRWLAAVAAGRGLRDRRGHRL